MVVAASLLLRRAVGLVALLLLLEGIHDVVRDADILDLARDCH